MFLGNSRKVLREKKITPRLSECGPNYKQIFFHSHSFPDLWVLVYPLGGVLRVGVCQKETVRPTVNGEDLEKKKRHFCPIKCFCVKMKVQITFEEPFFRGEFVPFSRHLIRNILIFTISKIVRYMRRSSNF